MKTADSEILKRIRELAKQPMPNPKARRRRRPEVSQEASKPQLTAQRTMREPSPVTISVSSTVTSPSLERNVALPAKQNDIRREMTIKELNEVLSSTIKHDDVSKAITFLRMLLAQTDKGQFNIGFVAESSTGKSHIPREIAEYFPKEERRTYAGASPTSFVHELGKLMPIREATKVYRLEGIFDAAELADEKRQVYVVDLERKIVILQDQPQWQLMEKLRPLLSHDAKVLRYSITDRSEKGGQRTKSVVQIGFPAIIMATTKPTLEEQERSRMIFLSPEATEEKIKEAMKQQGLEISDREAWSKLIDNHPERQWLKEWVLRIRATGIRNIIIPNWERILQDYLKKRPYLPPRTLRDWPRLLGIIQGCALLNCFNRVKHGPTSIIADQRDVEEGVALYDSVAEPNEAGLPPEIFRIFQKVILPLGADGSGVSWKAIMEGYFNLYRRPLDMDWLRRKVLPTLESVGRITQQRDPADQRRSLVYVNLQHPLFRSSGNRGSNSGVSLVKR
jgi:hypothetical protein